MIYDKDMDWNEEYMYILTKGIWEGPARAFFFFLSFLFPREKRAFSGFHVWRLHIGPTEQSLDIGSQRGFPVRAKMDSGKKRGERGRGGPRGSQNIFSSYFWPSARRFFADFLFFPFSYFIYPPLGSALRVDS